MMSTAPPDKLPPRFHNLFLAIASILVFIPLVFHIYAGRFSRYLADDFCTAAYFQRLGFLDSLEYWRLTWSGRYSFYFVINLTHLVGTWITPFMTAIALLAWLLAAYLLARQFLTFIKAPASKGLALFLAGFVLLATLSTSPDVYQSLYWQTGQVTYVYPLILLTSYAAFLLRKANGTGTIGPGDLLIAALVPLAAGGFSETIAALQVTFLAILVLIVLFPGHVSQRRKLILLLSVGLLGSIAAMALVVSAPGNQARLALMPARQAAVELAEATARAVYYYAKLTAYKYPLLTLTALLVPGLIVWVHPLDDSVNQYSLRKMITFLVLAPLAAVVLAASIIIPSIYATADIPAGRVVVTFQFMLLSAITAWSMHLGLWVRRILKTLQTMPFLFGALAGLLLAASVITASARILQTIPTAQAYAASWDRRDREIRSAVENGATEMQAASLPHMAGLAELNKNPDDWPNQCIASFYGLDKVSAKK